MAAGINGSTVLLQVRTGTGLGQRSTKAWSLTKRRDSVLRAAADDGKGGSFMGNGLKVWHIIPFNFAASFSRR